MAVTGTITPDRILTNRTARPGDAIILTKPIGVGIIMTAVKRGLADRETTDRAVQVMSALNRQAADTLGGFPVSACTDVTGFGLLGHLKEMAVASKVDAVVYSDRMPTIKQAWEFAAANIVPGGTLSNLDYVADGARKVEAEVISAFDLTSEQEQTITEMLKSTLGRDVSITTSTDESLIGGVVIKAGDTIIDGSMKSQLDSLALTLGR